MADPTITPEQREQKYWLAEIELSDKHFSDWFQQGSKLLTLYRNQGSESSRGRRFAMLWANTEVLKPSIYARQPVPQVSRRFKDADPIGRVGAELLERSASYEVERMNLDAVLRCVRDDLLLPGRGTAWVRYEADIERGPETEAPQADADDAEGYGDEADPGTINGQRVVVDYVPWRQFLHSRARTWAEVWWIGKISYMDADAGEKRFGKAWKQQRVQLDHGTSDRNSKGGDDDADHGIKPQATIYEIWCKKTGKVHFIAKVADGPLETIDPPLSFEGFWPCPRPVYSTLTTDSLKPIPDYRYYQDQAEEINDLTARIAALTDGLKLVGFYPSGGPGDVSSAIEKALLPSTQNMMIPVSSWAAFSEKGGKAGIVYLPLVEVVEAIKACVELRNQLVQDVYQITGISDILRGQTDSDETATAQSIKAQWGSVRIRDRQQEMSRFARDLIRMICEIVAEQFDPQRVLEMSNMTPKPPEPKPPAPPQMGPDGMPMPPQPDPEMVEYQKEVAELQQAFALLKDERLRGYRIDIETDSTIQPDEDAEKQRRVEFVTSIGALLKEGIPAVQVAPELAPLIGEVMMFTARGFRAGRMLEQQIEETMAKLQERLGKMAENPPPDPEQQKAQAQMQIMQAKAQADQQKAQMDMQAKQAEMQLELQAMQQEMQLKMQEMQMDLQMKREEMGLKREEMQMDMADKVMSHQMDVAMAKDQHEMQREQGELKRTEMHESHKMKMKQQAEAAKAKPKAKDNA